MYRELWLAPSQYSSEILCEIGRYAGFRYLYSNKHFALAPNSHVTHRFCLFNRNFTKLSGRCFRQIRERWDPVITGKSLN